MKENNKGRQERIDKKELLKKQWEQLSKKKLAITTIVSMLCLFAILTGVILNQKRINNKGIDPELARTMTYEQFQDGDENIKSTDNVKFSAFFLRDVNDDGYAEKIKGTCKSIGNTDTLYMELSVETEGKLKDAKISINGKNFDLNTNLVKDEQIKDNYISSSTKEISFNDIASGTQKLLTGNIKADIGDNISNYSKADNTVTLTGIYVAADGTEKEIIKEIYLTVDWYGKAEAEIYETSQCYEDIENRIDNINGLFNLDFAISVGETNRQLILSKNLVEGTMPDLNGYAPLKVEKTEGKGEFTYDEETKQFRIVNTATISEEGEVASSISNIDTYRIKAQYPLDAYESIGADTVTICIPVSTYYEAYNNSNSEFSNPYISNTDKATIWAAYSTFPDNGAFSKFNVSIEGSNYDNLKSRVVSKRKPTRIYQGISAEETNDTYRVAWKVYTGTEGESNGIIMKESKNNDIQVSDEFVKTDSSRESMEELTTNVGIGFYGASQLLNYDGWIKIYDDESGQLIETFTYENWNQYTAVNPYKYEIPVKHIRVETSSTKKTASMFVYCIKELDDEYITTNYTKEEFEELQHISSTLSGYIDGQHINTDNDLCEYEEEYSPISIKIDRSTISTHETSKNNKLTINTNYVEANNQIGWIDGTFLVKLPEGILATQVNDISIDNNNVSIENYEVLRKDGVNFIKINTKNSDNTQQGYKITINLDLIPSFNTTAATRNIELYAFNENSVNYNANKTDIYDINGNLNVEEKVGYAGVGINFTAPNTLLTNQIISEYDDKGSTTMSPEVAEITPDYAVVDNKERKAKIGVQIKNNYTSTISETKILGRIPFEGNTYALRDEELGSTYTAKIINGEIQIPEELQGQVTIYYSENGKANKDLSNSENEWKTADKITSWDNIKTYLIDFGETVIPKGKTYIFSYYIQIPKGLNINDTTYSHHGVSFSLDTEEGKYRTQIESNKIGIRIAQKYNLELKKYQTQTDKLVSGATYSVKEIINGEPILEGKTEATNEQGELIIEDLYVGKTYEIKEEKSPEDYQLNTDKVRYTTNVDENGNLTVEKLQGVTKEEMTATKDEEEYKVAVKVEDEAKAKLKIVKKEKGTDNPVKWAYYQIEGTGISTQNIVTDSKGEAQISGLVVNEEYTLQEIKATGYYLASQIKFKIVNNDGNYEVQITEGEVKENSITKEDYMPVASLTLEDEKIPTFDLEITKIKKTTEVATSTEQSKEVNTNQENLEVLAGAKFRLYKNNKQIGTYVTQADGKITINGLYQYVYGKDEDATYVLKEVVSPEGYSVIKDITFKVQQKDGKLEFLTTDDTQRAYTSEGNILKLQIEDSPIFKLVKKDGETNEVIANAKFAVFNMENESEPAKNSKGEIVGTKENINGKEYYTLTTNENGEFTVDLPEGEYKAIEVQAPEKYEVTDRPYYFAIGSDSDTVGLEAKNAISMTDGYGDRETPLQIINTSDGGYLVHDYVKLTKYNSEYEVQWVNDLNTSKDNYYNGSRNTIIEIKSGEYVVYSNVNSKVIKYNIDGEIVWEKNIEDTTICTITDTEDGGFLIGGYASNNPKILKYNENGELQWEKVLTTSEYAYVTHLKETNDGGFVVGIYAYTNSGTLDLGNGNIVQTESDNYYDIILAKYNSEGEVEWSNVIGGDGEDIATSIIEASDGSILIGGYFESLNIDLGNGVVLTNQKQNTSYRYGMIIKYNSQGQAQWAESTRGKNGTDRINSVIETNDGGYLVGGYIGTSQEMNNGQLLTIDNMNYAGIIVKYDTTGKVQWGKTINSPWQYVYGKTLIETSNGNYVIGGYTSGNIYLNNELHITKGSFIIEYSETQISKTITQQAFSIGGTNSDEMETIVNTQDGGYIVGGYFNNNIELANGQTLTTNGNTDGMIIKYNNDQVQWAKSIGGIGEDYITSIIETSDEGYIVAVDSGASSMTIDEENILNDVDGGVLLKYNKEGMLEWAHSSANIYQISLTKDNGFIAVGSILGDINLENNISISSSSEKGIIIKYNDKGEAQWAKELDDEVITIAATAKETKDNGYIIGGSYGGKNAVIIKLDSERNVLWTKSFTSEYFDWIGTRQPWKDGISSIIETEEGDYVIGGNYYGKSVTIDDMTLTNNVSDESTAILIKCSSEGKIKWVKNVEGIDYGYSNINSLQKTQDGGYIVAGEFTCPKVELENGVVLENNIENSIEGSQYYDGLIIKYDNNGEVQWAKNVGGNSYDGINSIVETGLGEYMVVGAFSSTTVELDNGDILENNEDNEEQESYLSDAMILKINEKMSGIEELIVENNRKQFEITTNIEELQGIKGGSISGEDEEPYETVKYGDSSTKEIKMTPDANYEIIRITVNGQEQSFEKAEDGSYTMPAISNITEDKNIVVAYAMKDNKLTINKVDGKSKTPLKGAEFKIYQDTENGNVLGSLLQNSTEDTTSLSVMNRMNQFYFAQGAGAYVSTNNLEYQKEYDMNGAPDDYIKTTISNTTANSMMLVNLKEKTGKYVIEVNAEVSSEKNKDFGYAVVSETAAPPTYETTTGKFIYISGEVEAQNYTYELEGGKVYYLHFGYRKDESEDVGKDRMIVNSVKLYTPSYNFVETDGQYELNKEDKTKNSYIPIDLTNYTGEYTVSLNAEISSEENKEIGYVAVTEDATIIDYANNEGTFVNITGEQSSKQYSTTLQGGKMYYLHFGYETKGSLSLEYDKFIIKNVDVTAKEYIVKTNSEGKGITQIPFGKYKIVETKAPEGYLLEDTPIDFEFTASGSHEVTIENTQSSKVIVHHYIKGTTEKLVEDEIIEGKEGEQYITAPQMDLEKYTLVTDQQGQYIVPENASGRYATESIEVVYEYEQKDIPLTVHHYIQGTTDKVPLENGELAEDIILKGKEGEEYKTSAISNNELSSEYELVRIPENAIGTYSETKMSVIYYYNKVERDMILTKYQEDGITPLAGAKFTIKAKVDSSNDETQEVIYTTDSEGKIQIRLGYGKYEVTEIEAPEGYVLPENPTTDITINRDIENKQLNITNQQERGTVIVHYYIEGTTQKVPLNDGGIAEDIIKTGLIGQIYASKEAENISKKYELISEPQNASGLISRGTTEVIYYYKEKEEPIIDNLQIVKTSTTQQIKNINEKISYTIEYTGQIKQYKGNAIITIVDELPYEIDVDEGKCNLAGGIYNEVAKTITWTESIENIDTFTNGNKQINFIKTIEIVYKDLDVNEQKVINEVSGKVELVDIDVNKIIETTKEIPLDMFTDIDVTLAWIDEENQRNKRPENLIIQVKKDDEVVDSKEITITKEESENKFKFEDLPKYDQEGNLINYTADESVLPGDEHKEDLKFYEKTIDGTTITNTIKEIPSKVVVKYLDKYTNEEISTKTEKRGIVGGDFDVTEDKKDIEGYTLVEEPTEKTGIYTENVQEIIYYYAKNTKVIVKYLEKDTEKILTEQQEYVQEGYVGKDYTTDKKEITGYIFVENTNNIQGKMAEEYIEVRYYYVCISQGVIEEHIDINTQKILYSEIHEGNEGDKYIIQSKTFEGYDLVTEDENGISKLPDNAEGEMTKSAIQVRYYYSKKASVKVEYIYKVTGEKIAEDTEINGHENDKYITEEKEIEGYDLVELPENKEGQMIVTENEDGTYNAQIIVQYYYNKKSGGVIEQYIDINSNEVIEEIKHEGNIGDEYEIIPKEIENYELVEEDNSGNIILPSNNKGKMTEEVIIVKYYYIRMSNVIVKYLDQQTGEEIHIEEIKGYNGSSYETEQKQFDEYELVEEPNNAKGEMSVNTIEVNYYYKRKAQVEVQYLEEETNNILYDSKIINGYVGDKYTTELKEIEYYKFVEVIGDVEGTMTKDKVIVKYYFRKQAFNFKVETWISNVTMDEISQGGKTLENKDEIYKLDVHRRKVNTSNIKITYKIRITNNGEIEGKVKTLTDFIPEGYSYNQEDNKINWNDKQGELTTTHLENETIKVGENKEIELVLTWNKGEDNFGQKINTVVLAQVENLAGYNDTNKEDDIAKADMIIAMVTGIDSNDKVVIIQSVLVVLVILLGYIVFYKRKRRMR